MIMERIVLENFRNHEKRVFEFCDKINIIFGKNASGKTNLLEAIYFCFTGKSFKSRDSQLITFGRDFFRIEADILNNDIKYHVVCYVDKFGIKRIMINDRKIFKLSELFERFKFVFFKTDDTNLIKSDPQTRRRFLDMVVIKFYPYMAKIFQDYARILQSRNAFLKSYDKKDIIDVYDIELSKLAYMIVSKRKEIINIISSSAKQVWSFFTKDDSILELSYSPSMDFESHEQFYQQLKKEFKNDLEAGYTKKGPHRDDFEILINYKNAKDFASEGQIKTACISIVLSSVKLFNNPVLLLDDIFSELDFIKRENILDFCKDYQTIITSAEDEKSILFKKNVDNFINIIHI